MMTNAGSDSAGAECRLTCPNCGRASIETMPTNACVYFHECVGCGTMLRPKPNVDDELLREAQRLTGIAEKTAVVREGLRALIERESARRLARLDER